MAKHPPKPSGHTPATRSRAKSASKPHHPGPAYPNLPVEIKDSKMILGMSVTAAREDGDGEDEDDASQRRPSTRVLLDGDVVNVDDKNIGHADGGNEQPDMDEYFSRDLHGQGQEPASGRASKNDRRRPLSTATSGQERRLLFPREDNRALRKERGLSHRSDLAQGQGASDGEDEKMGSQEVDIPTPDEGDVLDEVNGDVMDEIVVFGSSPARGKKRKTEDSDENSSKKLKTPKRAVSAVIGGPRRSARLRLAAAKRAPAQKFDKYFSRLPDELQLSIWDYAAAEESNARCVLIRNKAADNFDEDLINDLPSMFTTSVDSHRAISASYKRMFTRIGQEKLIVTLPIPLPIPPQPTAAASAVEDVPETPTKGEQPQTTMQAKTKPLSKGHYVNTDIDIIIYEPCCSGCRGLHCARRFFHEEDRASIHVLAVQTEHHRLGPNTWPCWRTITMGWTNVETLILITNFQSMPSSDDRPRALLRAARGAPEKVLQTRFDEWKATADGKESSMKKLEFAIMVPRQGLGKTYHEYDQQTEANHHGEVVILG